MHDNTNIGIDIIGHEATSSNESTDQARNGTVKWNTITNCIAEYATSRGIYIDGGYNITVENNISYHNGYGIEIGCENVDKTTENITVRNNLFYDNEVAGIAIGGFDYPNGTGKVVNVTINNNTLFKNDFSDDYTGELYFTFFENCTMINNIFYTTDQNVLLYAESTHVNLLMNYNLFYCPGGNNALEFDFNGTVYTGFTDYQTNSELDVNSSFADPLFVTVIIPNPDLHIQAGSPAINNGDPNYSVAEGENDIDGEDRIFDGRVDIGADEIQESNGIIFSSTIHQDIFCYPSISKGIIHIKSTKFDLNRLTYNVFNLNGKLVRKGNVNSNTLDISVLSSGLYYIVFTDHQNKVLVKQPIILI